MALTASQQAAYDTLVAQGRIEFANQFANAMTAVNAGVPVEQATQAAFSAPAPAPIAVQAPTPAAAPTPVPASAPEPVAANVDPIANITNQILGQGLTSQWSGEGFGSAEANARDMARLLASTGITDIRQFGKVNVAADAPVAPVYELRDAYDPEVGLVQQRFITGYVDDKGNAIDPNLVKTVADPEGGFQGYVAPVGTQQVFGNTVTGQALDPQYSRAGGNIFSGTFAGEGSTGYGVQFRDDGTPVFYTQYGGSTSDRDSLAPLLAIGGMAIAPWLSGQLAGLTGLSGAGLSAATGATIGGTAGLVAGGDLESALKGAVLGGAGGYLSGSLASGAAPGTDLGMNSNLTMAQIESGLGTPGYGYGAQAAASGLFNPALIGSGAYLDLNGVPTAYAPDNIDVGGGWSPNLPDFEMTVTGQRPTAPADIPELVVTAPRPVNQPADDSEFPVASYSNEGRNYPTPISTQGSGGSPVNASVGGGVSLGNVIRAIDTGAKIAALTGAGNAIAGDNRTGFDVVPVPSDWRSPTYGQAGARNLPPINFGTRELLRGTQWEKFLNPVQAPVVPAPQTGMTYGDLVDVLQNRQGGTLTIGDIISGITSQYGQANPSAVG